jgi:biotin carboxylase
MAKVLLVDTNFSSLPIYRALQRLGHDVHVVGNNAADCLPKIAINYWNLNYADTGVLATLVAKENFDFIVPGCTDRSYASCVAINNGRYPGLESTDVDFAVNNKATFRKVARELGLPVPQIQSASNPRWPLIVKPVDSFSGKGITVLMNPNSEALNSAIDRALRASTSGEYLIEDYVAGGLFSYSAILRNATVVWGVLVEEHGTANPFVVDTSRVCLRPDETLISKIRNAIEHFSKKLALKDGLLHAQFILDGEDIFIIEMTRRCPGDLYSQLIELSTGFNYAEAYIRPFIGMDFDTARQPIAEKYIMRHTLTVTSKNALGFIRFSRDVRLERWVPLSLVGDQLSPSPDSRLAVLFASAGSRDEFDDLFAATLDRKLYSVAS